MKFTILGASGFIGRHLCDFLDKNHVDYFAPDRNYSFNKNQNLGRIIYCIGLTADFRSKPIETVKAHVCKIAELLENSIFTSLLYLSSTRVYSGTNSGKESDDLIVNPNNFEDLYNISKLMGESICLSMPDERIKVARVSNVIGNDFSSDNFLFSLIRQAIDKKEIKLSLPLNYSKDYIYIDDVVKLIISIAQKGTKRLYNIASGSQVTNKEILDTLSSFIDYKLDVLEDTRPLNFPTICVNQIKEEFSFSPENILDKIGNLIENYRKHDTN